MHRIFQEAINQKDLRLAVMKLRLDNRDISSALPCTDCLKKGLP